MTLTVANSTVFKNVSVASIKTTLSTSGEFEKSDQLTNAQIKLIRSTDLLTQFSIRTDFKAKNSKTGRLEERFFIDLIINQ